MNFLVAGLLALQLFAVPPLTHEQQLQLDTAADNATVFDEGALYPLLNNAMAWKAEDETGATVPDYQAILDKPSEARGKLFLLEGYFFRSRPVQNLSRPGPWGDKLEIWSISPDRKGDQQIEVLLVDGPAEKDLPRIRQNVRLVARFFKIWKDRDYTGATHYYAVFVGQSAKIILPAGAGNTMTSAIPNPMLIAIIVFGSAVIIVTLFRLFSSGKAAKLGWHPLGFSIDWKSSPRKTEIEEPPAEPINDVEEDADPLPKDPIQAMQELERRRGTKNEEA